MYFVLPQFKENRYLFVIIFQNILKLKA